MAARRVILLLVPLLVAACAAYVPPVDTAGGRFGSYEASTIGDVTTEVAILSDAEARDRFGVDLAKQDLQALWLRIGNDSGRRLWLIRNVIDPDFFPADEVAWLVRRQLPERDLPVLRQVLRDASMRVAIEAGVVTEGFLFLPRREGGRYVEVRLYRDVWEDTTTAVAAADLPRELRFGFALSLPDGEFDYERLDPASVYAGQELPDLSLAELRAWLEQLPCCTTDVKGERSGDPLNLAVVGDAPDVLNALNRSGWSFTHRIDSTTIARELGAALSGNPYAVAPVSKLYALGRGHDVALQRARRSIAQRNHMRLWLAPFRSGGRQVWIGQVSRDIGLKPTTRSPTLVTHVIDPQVDLAREYLLHSLLAEGLVERFGFARGSAAASRAEPRVNLTDDPYFSDGLRLVILVAHQPVLPEQVTSLQWERSAPPVAEGQATVLPVGPATPGARPR